MFCRIPSLILVLSLFLQPNPCAAEPVSSLRPVNSRENDVSTLLSTGLEETPGPSQEGDIQERLRARHKKMVGGDPAFFELYLRDAMLRYGGDPQKVWEEVFSTLGTAAVLMKGRSPTSPDAIFAEARDRLNQPPLGPITRSELPWVLEKSPREVDRFRRLREVSGYGSAHSLEEAVGLSWSVVSRYEEGKRGLGFHARKKLQRFFEKKTGISLTLSFRVRPADLSELINGTNGTDQRLSILLSELLGWSYGGLIARANALRPKDELPVPPEAHGSFDSARPWTRRWIRNALERGLQEQYGRRVLLDGRLRAQMRSVQEVLRDLPTFEDRFNWLVDDWLIWSRSDLIRRAGIQRLSVGVRTFLKQPTQRVSRSPYRTQLHEVLAQGLAERGDPIALDEQLLPAAGLEESGGVTERARKRVLTLLRRLKVVKRTPEGITADIAKAMRRTGPKAAYWRRSLQLRLERLVLGDSFRSRTILLHAKIAPLLQELPADHEAIERTLSHLHEEKFAEEVLLRDYAGELYGEQETDWVLRMLWNSPRVLLHGSFIRGFLRTDSDVDISFLVEGKGHPAGRVMMMEVPLKGRRPPQAVFHVLAPQQAEALLKSPGLTLTPDRVLIREKSGWRLNGESLAALFRVNHEIRDGIRSTAAAAGQPLSETEIARRALAIQQREIASTSSGLEERFQRTPELEGAV